MKRIAGIVILMACVLASTEAGSRTLGSINYGYLYGKRVGLDDTMSALEGRGTWTYLDAELGVFINESLVIMIGVGGFQTSTEATTYDYGYAMDSKVTARNISVPLIGRVFLNKEADGLRMFLDFGPSFNFQKWDIAVSTSTVSIPSEKIHESKLGFLGGLGFLYPVGRLGILGRTRYAYVQEVGNGGYDASSFQFTVGLAF